MSDEEEFAASGGEIDKDDEEPTVDHFLAGDDDDDDTSTSVQADDVDGALALLGSSTVSINQDDNNATVALLPTNHLLAAAAAAAADMDINATTAAAPASVAAAAAPDEVDGLALISSATALQPRPNDVLSGRGASVNSNEGNKKFRALCFARKAEFEAGNHAAKRRVAMQIVEFVTTNYGSRFYKNMTSTATADASAKKGAAATTSSAINNSSGWYEMTREQALLKACQVMRDYKRPDRIAQREATMEPSGGGKKKRNRTAPSTPMDDVPLFPIQPIADTPEGVHDHDVLSGRGAFANGHSGNERLRKLASERKAQFDSGNCMARRTLALEIVTIIRNLDPPGRFLKQAGVQHTNAAGGGGVALMEGGGAAWEEVTDEKAIHKACQLMRDLDRPDRQERGGGERRDGNKKRLRKDVKPPPPAGADDHRRDAKSSSSSFAQPPPPRAGAGAATGTEGEHQEATDSITLLAETLVGDSSDGVLAAEQDDNNVDEQAGSGASSEDGDEQEIEDNKEEV